MPQAAEASKLEATICGDPDQLRLACDGLTDRLGEMYLDLADAFQRKDQPRGLFCVWNGSSGLSRYAAGGEREGAAGADQGQAPGRPTGP